MSSKNSITSVKMLDRGYTFIVNLPGRFYKARNHLSITRILDERWITVNFRLTNRHKVDVILPDSIFKYNLCRCVRVVKYTAVLLVSSNSSGAWFLCALYQYLLYLFIK